MQLYFAEHRERIPEGIVVTGYDGRDEYAVGKLITTAEQKLAVKICDGLENYREKYPEDTIKKEDFEKILN